MLEARELCKTYGTDSRPLEVLRGVSLQVEPGTCLAVTGPSGAGKSTLLHLLAGLDLPTSGEVLWNAQPLSSMDDRQRAGFRNEMVGIVFQFYHLVPELTALENVMLPACVRRGGADAAIRERARACLEQVGLAARATHRPNALSGGELQRAAIARALMNGPQLLLCDEPTGNLDSGTGAEIAALLMRLRRERGMTVVLVTHEQSLAALADRRIALRDGRLVDAKPVGG